MPALWSPETAKAAAIHSSQEARDILRLDPLADARESCLNADEMFDMPMVQVEPASQSSRRFSTIRILPKRVKSLAHIMETEGLKALVGRVLHMSAFDNFVSLVIVGNSVSIALEQSHRMERKDTDVFRLLEWGFLAFYIIELGLIFFAYGWRCVQSNWVRFDCVLVLTGIVSSSVEAVTGSGSDSPLSSLIVLRMVRLVRLARLARTMRLVIKFRELWLLAWGLVNCISTAFHTLVFGLILLYVVGCVAMELIPLALQDDTLSDSIRTIINDNFTSLPRTMLTLVQFVTLDNAVSIYRPLIEVDPYLTIFFIAVLLILGVVFMNMVTALIVTSGLDQAMRDSSVKKAVMDTKRKRLLVDLEDAFHRADVNNSGTVCRRELADIDPESGAHLQEILGFSSLADMFDFLDVDGSEEIDIDEFCNGAASIVLSDTAPEIKRMERMMKSMQHQLRRSEHHQEHVANSLGRIESLLLAVAPDSSPGIMHTDEKREEAQHDLRPCADAEGGSGRVRAFTLNSTQRPAWASELVAELKEAYSTNVNRTVKEACAVVMAEAAGDFVSSPPSSQWEVLPPSPPPPWRSEGSAPAQGSVRSCSWEPRPRGVTGQWARQEDQQVQRNASYASRHGGAVPASCRPMLLSGSPSQTDTGLTSIYVCRQEL